MQHEKDHVLDQVSPAWYHILQNRDKTPVEVSRKASPQAGLNQGKMKSLHGLSNIAVGIP